jgi:hypothetical protein
MRMIALVLVLWSVAAASCARRDLDWNGLSREVGQRVQREQER